MASGVIRDYWTYRETVSVVDVLDAGACYSGTRDWVAEHGGAITASVSRYRKNEHIERAANSDGSGYGNGNGDGNGYGDGNGDGNGYGYGNGYGE